MLIGLHKFHRFIENNSIEFTFNGLFNSTSQERSEQKKMYRNSNHQMIGDIQMGPPHRLDRLRSRLNAFSFEGHRARIAQNIWTTKIPITLNRCRLKSTDKRRSQCWCACLCLCIDIHYSRNDIIKWRNFMKINTFNIFQTTTRSKQDNGRPTMCACLSTQKPSQRSKSWTTKTVLRLWAPMWWCGGLSDTRSRTIRISPVA